MFAPNSNHKRKRSSTRRHLVNQGISSGNSIVSLIKCVNEEEEKEYVTIGEESILKKDKKVEDLIDSHLINHSLHVILPLHKDFDEKQISNDILKGKISIISYYAKITLKLFLDPLFVVTYIKRGNLTVLSIGELDKDDIICIDGKGKLHLSLTKDSYQTLGLQGQALKSSKTSSGKAADRKSGPEERFIVSINLLDSSFEPGKPGYERVKSRFDDWDIIRGDKEHKGNWDVLMCWCNEENPLGGQIRFPTKNVIQSSIKELPFNHKMEIVDDVWIPLPQNLSKLAKGWSDEQNTNREKQEWFDWYESLTEQMEWSSFNLLGCSCIRTFWRSDNLNTYSRSTEQHFHASKVFKITYTGFLPSGLGKSLVNQIRILLSDDAQKIFYQFGLVQAIGFADMPICWSSKINVLPSSKTSSYGLDQEGMLTTDEDEESTGKTARRKRNKQRKKRGYTNPNQHGHQTRNEHSIANTSGWQIILFDQSDHKHKRSTDYIVIENIGDSQRS